MKTTVNYGLKKPDGTDVVNINDFNVNADILDAEMKKSNNNINSLSIDMVSLKKSVSDGKKLVASAITEKGQATHADAAFKVMADNIKKIETESVLSGTATADQVMAGSTFYKDNPKSRITGTMTNRGAVTFTLNAGGSYTIPSGYHNGSGKVITNTLASQTLGNATAAHILSGKTAWVNGNKIAGNLVINSIVNFKAALYSTKALLLTWQNPTRGPYSGVMIRYKLGSYPASVNDGIMAYEGAVTSVILNNLVAGTVYCYKAFSYVATNTGRLYAATQLTASAIPLEIKGMQTFTSSGVFTVPLNVYSVDVFCVGGGGRGSNGGNSDQGEQGSGGGGGYTSTRKSIPVTPEQNITVVVASSGGLSKFGSLLTAEAGLDGRGNNLFGGAGGSGGGAGDNTNNSAGAGGSNGSNGQDRYPRMGGQGQVTTTRAFAEPTGTLYAGGGGGGLALGGSGGGGSGGRYDGSGHGLAGAVNTGGGGGGGAGSSTSSGNGGLGGSGIVLLRWGY